MQRAMNVGISDHRVELGRRAALGLENAPQRRTRTSQDRVADVIRHDGDAAHLQRVEGAARIVLKTEKTQTTVLNGGSALGPRERLCLRHGVRRSNQASLQGAL